MRRHNPQPDPARQTNLADTALRGQMQKRASYVTVFMTSSIGSSVCVRSHRQTGGEREMGSQILLMSCFLVRVLGVSHLCKFISWHRVWCFFLVLSVCVTPVESSQAHMKSYLMAIERLKLGDGCKPQAVHFISFSEFPSQPQFIPPEMPPSSHQPGHWEAFPPKAQCFLLDQNGTHGTMGRCHINRWTALRPLEFAEHDRPDGQPSPPGAHSEWGGGYWSLATFFFLFYCYL